MIGGQAVIAYGASQFTRDADLWVKPTKINLERLKRALDQLGAKSRFLPPLELRYLKKGHGVHFKFRHNGYEYLIDILGQPPRVKSFNAAIKKASFIKWNSLSVPVIDVQSLVETKKTNRDKDYLVIQKLTDDVYKTVKKSSVKKAAAIIWLMENLRTPRHLLDVVKNWPKGKALAKKCKRPVVKLILAGDSREKLMSALMYEQERLKEKNREYWKPFLAEIRGLRRKP